MPASTGTSQRATCAHYCVSVSGTWEERQKSARQRKDAEDSERTNEERTRGAAVVAAARKAKSLLPDIDKAVDALRHADTPRQPLAEANTTRYQDENGGYISRFYRPAEHGRFKKGSPSFLGWQITTRRIRDAPTQSEIDFLGPEWARLFFGADVVTVYQWEHNLARHSVALEVPPYGPVVVSWGGGVNTQEFGLAEFAQKGMLFRPSWGDSDVSGPGILTDTSVVFDNLLTLIADYLAHR